MKRIAVAAAASLLVGCAPGKDGKFTLELLDCGWSGANSALP